jgi:hypothetical protein
VFIEIPEADFLGIAEIFIQFQCFHLVKQLGHLNFEEEGFLKESVGGK